MTHSPVESGPHVVTVTAMLGDSTLTTRRLRRAAPCFTAGPSARADLPVQLTGAGDELFPLVQLTAGGARVQVPGGAAQDVPAGGHLLVPLGSVSLLVQSAPAGKLKGAFLMSGIDWEAQIYRAASFMVHAVFLFLALALPPEADAMGPDMGKLRKVTMTLPTIDREDAVQPWLRPAEADQAAPPMKDERRPRRARAAGSGGDPTRPPGGPIDARHLAEATARGSGLLHILDKAAGSNLASIFQADSALSDGAMAALDGLQGDAIGEGSSVGGLSLTSLGGWGPGSGIAAGPLGTIGKRGGGPGGPGGDYGGGFHLPRRPRPSRFKERVAQPTVEKGALSKSIIRRVIRRHLNEVRYCYQRELQTRRDLYGRLIVKFTIAPNGMVVAAGIKQSTLGNTNVETCIARAVRRWLFPKPRDGGIVQVSYPFVLKSAGER